VVVVVGPGSECPPGSTDPDCDTTTVVPSSELAIVKSFTGNTGGTGPGGIPEAKIGDILTFTLTYTLAGPPVHNGVITDVLPQGLAYVPGSATDSVPGAEFSFSSYTAVSRTLRWDAPLVSTSGSVTYMVVVLAGADELPQPLENVAVIDSDETPPDEDRKQVFVEPPPPGATATPRVTLPPTSTLDGSQQSGSGASLVLVLFALAGVALVLGLITPVPARVRRRVRR